ncbi:MAG TPA: DMT family transporter [Telluria sp.]|nr:DMT family transporter [Telluria sp.]
MNARLTPSTALLLTVPPVLWAGNAIAGRILRDVVPPMTLNLLRWSIAMLIVLPLARAALVPGSGLFTNWKRFGMLGLLGIGVYNSLQYLALQTSTPINVTLVAAGMPVWMMLIGVLFFKMKVGARQVVGAVLSIAGVLLVLSRGELAVLQSLRLVPGDLYMIAASIAWAFYTWLLMRPGDPPAIRSDWAAFLFAQMLYGVAWSGLFTAAEWTLAPVRIDWGWPLVLGLLYVAVGPGVLALRSWGAGVGRAGPNVAAFFGNLTPLFAALFTAAFLGEMPQLYHAGAFALIVAGILFSSRR